MINEKARTVKKEASIDFTKTASRRVMFARWLLEKLLGSFFISAVISFGPFFGFYLNQSSFQLVYFLITSLSITAYIISILLIPIRKKPEK